MNPLPMHKDSPKKVQTILCTKSVSILDDAFSGKAVPEPAATGTTAAVEEHGPCPIARIQRHPDPCPR